MEIPDNWQEELMLREWKKMRVERCKLPFRVGNIYRFPNGIQLEHSLIQVDLEKAPALMVALSDFEPRKDKNKDPVKIRINMKRYKEMTEGEIEDFRWLLHSLDI